MFIGREQELNALEKLYTACSTLFAKIVSPFHGSSSNYV